MDQQTEQNSKKKTAPKCRRLGLSRISPRNQSTQLLNRSVKANNVEQIASTATPEAAEDIGSMITPTKKRKITFDRFQFTPKEQMKKMTEEKQKATENIAKNDDELKAEIQQLKEHLGKYDKYKNEKKELEHLIDMWRAGGNRAVRQLQTVIQPKQEIEKILEHFQLPVDIFGDFTE